MPPELNIRKAKQNSREIEKIVDFNIRMAQETENKILDRKTISAGVENLMNHPEWGFYIVAESNRQIVGSLMITYEWSDWRNGLFWWIQSVYVIPEFRRKKVYSRLYQFVKKTAEKHSFDQNLTVIGFRLYVEKSNRIAQKTYKTLGMIETSYALFEAFEKEE